LGENVYFADFFRKNLPLSAKFTFPNLVLILLKLIMSLLHEDLTKKIIACFYNVYNELDYEFLEKVFSNERK
jgi:hypothetical protein